MEGRISLPGCLFLAHKVKIGGYPFRQYVIGS